MGIRTTLEQNYDYDIVDEFLDHFDVMTEVMEPAIISLENPKVREEKINELFRIFHNIKSASGFLKLERIHLLAELAEEVMEKLRSGEREVTPEIVDWLLLVNDQLRTWYRQIADDEALGDTDVRILQLP
ncbi:Hpt domain-containing protein [Hydrogenimonas sp. SS33]|uniref:Hpt domain-containing protein n=1 Tax=Hydrogenimonas leucolamina TaxID=2954236 RepID=UPI00336BFBC2